MARTLPIGGRGTCVPVGAAPLGRRSIGGRSRGARRTTRSGSWSRRSSCSGRAGRPSQRSTSDSSSGGRRSTPFRGRASDSIASVIRPLGLVRRAATLKSLAAAVVERGNVPDSMEELMEPSGRRPVRGERHARRRVRAACSGGRRSERTGLPPVLRSGVGRACRVGRPALGAGGGGHAAPTDPRVELVGAGSGRVGMPPEGSAVRGVSTPGALCLVNVPIGLGQRSVLSSTEITGV